MTDALIVSLSPVVYQSIEKIEMVLVSIILVFLVFAIFIATKVSAWTGVITQAPSGVANLPHSVGVLERVMNSIRKGLGIGETEIAREPSRP
jgi:hypothetical protein